MKNIFLQWLIETKNYDIEIFSHIEKEGDITYIVFESGNRCNIDLINDIGENNKGNVMAFLDNLNSKWTIKEKIIGGQEEVKMKDANGVQQVVQPYIPGRKVVEIIPPKKTSNIKFKEKILEYNNQNHEKEESISVIEKAPITSEKENVQLTNDKEKKILDINPVHILVQSSKKENSIINMELDISIPSKEIYTIIENNFENGTELFLNYIIDKLDIQIIKDSLKNGLKNYYSTSNIQAE